MAFLHYAQFATPHGWHWFVLFRKKEWTQVKQLVELQVKHSSGQCLQIPVVVGYMLLMQEKQNKLLFIYWHETQNAIAVEQRAHVVLSRY